MTTVLLAVDAVFDVTNDITALNETASSAGLGHALPLKSILKNSMASNVATDGSSTGDVPSTTFGAPSNLSFVNNGEKVIALPEEDDQKPTQRVGQVCGTTLTDGYFCNQIEWASR